MTAPDILDELHLQDFQKRTVQYVYKRMFEAKQRRFLVADEVGLGKTKVAQGVIARATAGKRERNVLYLASSGNIVTQNLQKLKSKELTLENSGSLCLLAQRAYTTGVEGRLIGITPIKDLRIDHFGSIRERVLLYRLVINRYRSLREDQDVRKFFMGKRYGDDVLARFATTSLPKQLRDDFEMQLGEETIAQLKDPLLRKKHKRAIIGGLRALLSACVLKKLNPVLVVVDEIQRFSEALLGGSPSPQVKYILGRPILVLSATPYQPGDPGDHGSKDPHNGFIRLVSFLNQGQTEKVADVRLALTELRSALTVGKIRKEALQQAVAGLGAHLRQFMVRTERPFDAHVERISVDAPINESDLQALQQAVKLLKEVPSSAKNKRHRFGELVELWKSTPYVVSALSKRYVTGADFSRVVGTKPPSPAALSSGQLYRRTPLVVPANARLRAMIKEMGTDATERRLWLPPSKPYIKNTDSEQCTPASKTLVFTSWGAAPPAIATALNLYIEPRLGRDKDLEFSRVNKLSQKHKPVRSVLAIGAPLWKFAENSDPFEVMRGGESPLSQADLIAGIQKQLVRAGIIKISRSAKTQNTVDIALGLNTNASYPKPTSNSESYVQPALDLMVELEEVSQVTLSKSDANDLAEMAAAAPGTCAYRALRRAIPALDQDRPALFEAAISIGSSITRMFQRPSAVAIVGDTKKAHPYWRRVLRYCLQNDLQSVLDEYIFLLVRDSSERRPGKLACEVADTIHAALGTVGTLQVARPRAKEKAPYGPAMYARSLGESNGPTEDIEPAQQVRRDKKTPLNRLLTAFNSPFPPFVLTTTSTGQEGLDMHRYCRRLVHWNLPSSPMALEQREGRVDRYLSLGVRTNIAKLQFAQEADTAASPSHPWELLLQQAKNHTAAHTSILAPLWHFGDSQPIKAIAVNIPFSREATAWDRLLEDASMYRLVLGQPNPHALLKRLSNSSEENRQEIAGIRLDLSPPVVI